MEGITKITVENVNGSIEATAWDKPYFKVHAIKRADGGRAEETLKLTEIRVRKVGDEIRIETVNPKRRRLFGFLDFGSPNAHVDYVLQIPGRTAVHFETCNGRVAANGFSGSLSGDAVNGSIELADIEGPTSASTVNGSVRLAFKGPLKKSRIETVNGSIDVAFQKASSVKYDLETVNGHIEGDFDLRRRGQVRTQGGARQLQRRRRGPPLRDGQRHDPAQDELVARSRLTSPPLISSPA